MRLILAAALLFPGLAGAESGDGGPVGESLAWTREFPGKVFATTVHPGGVLEVRGQKGRHYVGSRTGIPVWEGDPANSWLMEDVPFPIFVDALPDKPGHTLVAVGPRGKALWRNQHLDRDFVCGRVAPTAGVALTLSTPKQWWMGGRGSRQENGFVRAVSLVSGAALWETPLAVPLAFPDTRTAGRFAFGQGAAYLAAGGVLARLDLKSGALSWTAPLALTGDSDLAWEFRDGDALLAAGGEVLRLGPAGVLWRKTVEQDAWADDLFWTPAGILAGFRYSYGTVIVLLDPDTGAERWRVRSEETFEHRKQRISPARGMAVSGGEVRFVVDGRLRTVSLADGKETSSLELDRDSYPGWRVLVQRQDRLILMGSGAIECRSGDGGSVLWRHHGFETPLEINSRHAGAAGAIMAGANAFATSLASSQGHYYANLARQKRSEGSAYRGDSVDYEALARQALSQAESARADGQVLASLAEIQEAAQPAWRNAFDSRLQRYAAFMKPLNPGALRVNPGSKSVVVLVDLDTGEARETRLVEGRLGCMPDVVVDPVSGLAFETYTPRGMLCKQARTVDAVPTFAGDPPQETR